MLFSYAFLIMPESPTPLLGRDILARFGTTIGMAPEQVLGLLLVETEIDPEVWATQRKVGRAVRAAPVQIHLRDSASFPHQKQYPLQPEAGRDYKL